MMRRRRTTQKKTVRRAPSLLPLLPLLLLVLLLRPGAEAQQRESEGSEEEQTRARNDNCELFCENGGDCELGAEDGLFERYEGLNLPFLEKSAQEMTQEMHCVCPPGYIGYRCEVALAPCGDEGDYLSSPSSSSSASQQSHICLNGAKCKEGISDAGQEFFYCDCTAAGAGAVDPLSFAGRMCEHASTVFCGRGDPNPSRHTFCTNGGTCIEEDIDINDEHPGCICPDGWEGRHCQYVLGTAPESEAMMELLHQPQDASSNKESLEGSGGSKRGHLSFLLIITVVCVSSAFLILVVMREVHRDMARSSTQEAVVNPNPIPPSSVVHDSERGLGSGEPGPLGGPLTGGPNDRRMMKGVVPSLKTPPPSTIMEAHGENGDDDDDDDVVDVDVDDDSSGDELGTGRAAVAPSVNELL